MDTVHMIENQHYVKGVELFDHGLYAEAIEEFEQVIRSLPEGNAPERKLASFYICEAYTNLGMSHLRMNMHRRAEEELKLAAAISPTYADLHFYLGLVQYRQGRYAKAEEEFQRALAVNSRYARALMYLGLTYLHTSSKDGMAYITKAVEIEPAYKDERYDHILSLTREDKTEGVVKLAEEMAELDVDQISYLLEKGRAMMKLKEYAEASDAFLEAVSICPGYADIRNLLGQCYIRQGLLNLAVDQFANALEINPAFIEAHINLAALYEKEGKRDFAIEELHEVLGLEPDNHIASRMLLKLKEGR